MRTILFLDFDDVLCLNNPVGGYDAIEALGRLEKEPGLSFGDLEFVELWRGLFDAQAKAFLTALHAEFKPTYVLSTSWRNFMNRAALDAVLRRGGLPFVADNLHENFETPISGQGGGSSGRAREIQDWLNENPGCDEGWVVLDDELSGATFLGWHDDRERSFIVLCRENIGLTEVEYALLRDAFLQRAGRKS
ncbi:hypothetical protein Rfer_3057 [Rhodoferax ferrireducens T118]|uniref:Uncharacterized protein n=1 Tax=Albidiferax ferrireducens (strain ATCC BAA-621 / DSM 15236 / T118) TaxID=338969 RepID=Q21TY6_ALBFT|nr:HAD domain-containing protein [Rhodoferax ferrireducens]ABD70767.1 hypothetical protein Rfer_3057 [Rhodoferax ferrireducens T118]